MKISRKITDALVAFITLLFLEFLAFWAKIEPRGLYNPTFIKQREQYIQNIIVIIVYYFLTYFLISVLVQYVVRDGRKPASTVKKRFLTVLAAGTALRLLLDVILFISSLFIHGFIASQIILYFTVLIYYFGLFVFAFYIPLYRKKAVKLQDCFKIEKRAVYIISACSVVAIAAAAYGILKKAALYNAYFSDKLNISTIRYLQLDNPKQMYNFEGQFYFAVISAIIGFCCFVVNVVFFEKFIDKSSAKKQSLKKDMVRFLALILVSPILLWFYSIIKITVPSVFPYSFEVDYPSGKYGDDLVFSDDISTILVNEYIDSNHKIVAYSSSNGVLCYLSNAIYRYSSKKVSGWDITPLVTNPHFLSYSYYTEAIIYKKDNGGYTAIPAKDICRLSKDNDVTAMLTALVKKLDDHRIEWAAYCAEYLMKYNKSAILPELKRYCEGKYTHDEISDSTEALREKTQAYFKQLIKSN